MFSDIEPGTLLVLAIIVIGIIFFGKDNFFKDGKGGGGGAQ